MARQTVSPIAIGTIVLLLGGAMGLQAARDGVPLPPLPSAIDGAAPTVQSTRLLTRVFLGFDALAADVYWMRVVQRYGRTKLSNDPGKRYDFLYPLLEATTALDPHFEIAYRYGATFLAEAYPGGAGRPDLALALLEKGLSNSPAKWQYAQDAGFIHYWWRHDFVAAAEWFTRASRLPGAPNWLAPMAAVTLTQGGNRDSARRLWGEVASHADTEWLTSQARVRLRQLDALDEIDALESVVRTFASRRGNLPETWMDVVSAGLLRGVPRDPHGFDYQLNPYWGTVTLSERSTLAPLPTSQVPR